MATLPIREARATVVERLTGAALGSPISLTVTQDEEWSPRVQGVLVAPLRLLDELAAPFSNVQLGKLQADYLHIELETRYGPGLSCADLPGATAALPGSCSQITRALTRVWYPGEPQQPLAAATELWHGNMAEVTADVGGSVAQVTDRLRQPGGTHRIPATERRVLRVRRRKETTNALDGTVTITFSGEDVRLHDFRHTGTTAYVNLYTRLRPLVDDVLGKITAEVFPEVSVKLLGGADVTIETGQEWKPAQTAWEFLHPILESVGWALYADLTGAYRLEPRTTKPAPHDLDAARDLIDFTPERDRAEGYYDGAMVEYTDADPNIPARRWDIYAPPGAQRIAHETRPGTRPTPGAAERLVERSLGRSGLGSAEATVQLMLEPGHRPTFRTPTGNRQGTITAITHTYPARETTLGLRDIITT